MGVYLEFVDHERDFNTMASTSATILNDFNDESMEQKERLNKIIYTVRGDVFSNVPQCECGNPEIRGRYNIGIICSKCGTPVKEQTAEALDTLTWIRAPKGVAPFMKPKFWWMLTNMFIVRHTKFSIIHYLADSTYNPETRTDIDNWYNKFLFELKENGITGRGWNYFYENFDRIIDLIFNKQIFKKTGKTFDEYKPMYDLIKKERHLLFTHYLPIPNRSLLLIEEVETGLQRDKEMDLVLDAIRNMAGIDVNEKKYSIRVKENRTVKTVDLLSTYYAEFEKSNAKKEGIWRKHIGGGRGFFTARGVISSITEPHRYSGIYYPWGMAMAQLKYHIHNKLFKKTFNVNKQLHYLDKHALEYDKLLDDIFKELIEESPYSGIPVNFIRNPVLMMGSNQQMFIEKVKTNVTDTTISASILIVVPFNLDFDGDAMTVTLSLDNKTAEVYKNFAPHQNGFSMNKPFEVSSNCWLPKPVIATINNWIHDHEHDRVDPVKLNRMRTLL